MKGATSSVAPAGRTRPRLRGRPPLSEVVGCTRAITSSLSLDKLDFLGKRTKPDRSATNIDILGVGNRERTEDAIVLSPADALRASASAEPPGRWTQAPPGGGESPD